MPEYNIGFSEKLIEAAQVVSINGIDTIDAQRTVLYLSLLSCEISLKAFLENAGVQIKEIASCLHNLRALLDAVCRCEVQEVVAGQFTWVSHKAKEQQVFTRKHSRHISTEWAIPVPSQEWARKPPASFIK